MKKKRHRYVGFKISLPSSESRINKKDVIYTVRDCCKNIFNKDCREMGIRVIRFDGSKGIVKCNHIEKDNTIKLLKSINNISSHKVKIETVGTSGTIKSLLRKHMGSA